MQITNSVGNIYDVVEAKGDVCRVADPKTHQVIGFVAYANCGHISVYGPLAKTPELAVSMARKCAYNRYYRPYDRERRVHDLYYRNLGTGKVR